MHRKSTKQLLIAGLFLAFAIVPFVAGLLDQPFYVAQFRRVIIFAMAAVSLDLILGFGRMVSFGHAAFIGIGAYTVAILNVYAANHILGFGWIPGTANPLITWPVAMIAAACVALVIGAISLRTSGLYFIMITLAFAQMAYYFFVGLRAYGGEDGFRFAGATSVLGIFATQDETRFYYLLLFTVSAVIYCCYRLINSRFGRVLRGCGANELRMRALGYNTYAFKLVSFSIAGGIAGLSGAMLATTESYVSPAMMHWTQSGNLIVMVVVGGVGTLFGPVLGATVFVTMDKFLPDLTEHWMVLFGPVLVLLAIFAHGGIINLIPGWKDKR